MSTATLTYAYKGRDNAGKIVKGNVDAASSGAAVNRLRIMGISPLTVEESRAGTGLNAEIKIPGLGEKSVKLKDLAVMSRQMATMISAGLSLLRTLNILADQTESKALKGILEDIRNQVESGISLSDAMQRHSKDFPPLMINMVRAGETGGFLEGSLLSIAENYEKEVRLNGKIKSALTYPIVIISMALLAVIGMLIFIVPVFKDMFDSMGATLPVPTQILVVLSDILPWAAGPLIVGGIIFGVWWKKNKNELKVRRVVDPWKLKMPVFGDLNKKIGIARFARNFSSMMAAGVPILHSLSIVGETSGNWVIEDALTKVQASVRQGHSVAGPLAEEPVFPSMVVQMVAVGEDSGSLETMLGKIADFYDEEVESTTEALTSLIEPLMIAVVGILLGGMIVALYMPIFDIFNHIK